MPLTRIKNTAIGDDGVTTRKLDDTSGGFTMPGQQFMKVPVGQLHKGQHHQKTDT